jgi:endonuclease/exonuclease/phosphatase (EEP) superfamily protein YafD
MALFGRTVRQWIARSLIGLVSLASLGLALAYQLDTTPVWWIELLRYLPFFAVLPFALLGLGLSLWLGWFWRLLSVAALALLLTEVMGLSLGPDRVEPPADASRTVRLMSYNIKSYHADGFGLIAEEISRHHPDIVVMQDAQMLEQDNLPPELRPTLSELRYHYGHGQYVLFSRYPLRGCELPDLSYPAKKSEYVHCVLQVGRSEIDLIVVHLVSPREGLNAARHDEPGGMADWQANFTDRLHQSRVLANGLLRLRRPVIVAGDLNAAEHSPVVRQLLDTGLRDAFSAAGTGYGYTIGHALKLHLSFLRIDHILVTPSIGVSRCVTGWRGASEHRPVIADLVLPAPKARQGL